jgi:hypothetical protein
MDGTVTLEDMFAVGQIQNVTIHMLGAAIRKVNH